VQLRIDDATIDMLGLKLVIRLKAVDSVLQHVEIPNRLPDGVPD